MKTLAGDQKEKLRLFVVSTLQEACKAARTARKDFSRRNPEFAKGKFADCGWTWIDMHTKDRGLCTILREMNLAERVYTGVWELDLRWTTSYTQSVNIKEAALEAAKAVLEHHLGDRASFTVVSRIN